jgi:hypothetical protein
MTQEICIRDDGVIELNIVDRDKCILISVDGGYIGLVTFIVSQGTLIGIDYTEDGYTKNVWNRHRLY